MVRLEEDGVTSALFSLGGNIQTIGTKPDGEKWYIGIKDPESDGYLGGVRVQDEAVITSGGYERYFTDDDGTIYWHIMDPSTGAPGAWRVDFCDNHRTVRAALRWLRPPCLSWDGKRQRHIGRRIRTMRQSWLTRAARSG